MKGRAISVAVLLALFLAGTGWGEPVQKKSLSLEDARKAAVAAATEAKKNKWNMAIAVVDDGGIWSISSGSTRRSSARSA